MNKQVEKILNEQNAADQEFQRHESYLYDNRRWWARFKQQTRHYFGIHCKECEETRQKRCCACGGYVDGPPFDYHKRRRNHTSSNVLGGGQ